MTLGEKVTALEEKIENAIADFENNNDWQIEDVHLHKIDITTCGQKRQHLLNNVTVSIIKKR